MMVQRADNRRLFSLFIFLALVSFILSSYLWWTSRLKLTAYKSVKSDYLQMVADRFKRIENHDYLEASLAEYHLYKNQGKIGAIDRIEWVDALAKIGEKMQLSHFSYELSPSRNIENSQLKHTKIQAVDIVLRIGFSHDGEIFQFFNHLTDRISAGFEVIRIDIKRVARRPESDQLSRPVNLELLCDIRWYSIIPLVESQVVNSTIVHSGKADT